jgi:hypothetical protein
MKSLDLILDVVARQLPAAGIDCLLIGGFAVNHYGYTRSTLDIDFMVVSDRMGDIRRILRSAGFTNIDARDEVTFFSRPGENLRADFLRVDESTMRRLLVEAVGMSLRGHALKLPSLRDLLAMKIFAFSHDVPRRMGKDLPDIAHLSVLHDLNLEADLRPLCDRFGTPEAFDLIRRQVEALRTP